jgi:hypothetical protein
MTPYLVALHTAVLHLLRHEQSGEASRLAHELVEAARAEIARELAEAWENGR